MELGIISISIILFLFAIYFVLIFVFLFATWLFGAPFQPTSDGKVRQILKFAGRVKGKKVLDIGSGDGRIVAAFAKKGAEAHGFEINPFLVLYSKLKMMRLGLRGKAFIHWGSFWLEDFGRYDILVLFQIGYIMKKLERKIGKESKRRTKIISHYWKFPNWKIIKGKDEIYLYRK